ncbi:MAG: transcriptional regulator [Clostridium sp.]
MMGKGQQLSNKIAEFIKINRKAAGLTQEAIVRSGLGLRFVRELEQGKRDCTDGWIKVNVALSDV